MCIELRSHNQKTYNKIKEMWKEDNRVASVQPTGTGKSFIILKCAESFGEELKVVVTPNNHIINQLIEHADGKVTNIKYITYPKLMNMTEEELKAIKTNFIALDEFHRCGADVWGEGVKRLLEAHPDAKVLGTSATPIRFLDGGRDMSDELFDGHLACNMTLPQAIVEGILQMPKYVSALYTFDTEADKMIDKVNKSKNTDEEKKDIIKDIKKLKRKLDKSHGIPVILAKHITKTNGKYIVFCENKNHLEEMKDVVIEWFKTYFKKKDILNTVITYEVYSDLLDSDEQLESFEKDNTENAIKLLFSINMLNEGLHMKNLDGVILLRPTTSPTIYYQQIGRVIDAGRDDQTLILDFVNNFDSIKKNSLRDELEVSAREHCSNNGISGDAEEEFVDKFRIIDETYNVINLFNEIEEKLYVSWDLNVLAIVNYIEREGNSYIPYRHIETVNGVDIRLGVFRQGLLRGDYSLTEKRVEQLNNIGFSFKRVREQRYSKDFNFWYNLNKEIKDKTGVVNFNTNYKYDGFKIGKWQYLIRQKEKNNKLDKLEIIKLKNIGFDFDFNVIGEKNRNGWNAMYLQLLEYYNKYGNVDVPYKYEINGTKLGLWIREQKVSYIKNRISEYRIDKLKQIGFDFGIRTPRKIICLETKDIFDTLEDASKWCGLKNSSSLTNHLHNKSESSGKLSDGTKLHWMYLDEYLKLHPEEVENLKEAV